MTDTNPSDNTAEQPDPESENAFGDDTNPRFDVDTSELKHKASVAYARGRDIGMTHGSRAAETTFTGLAAIAALLGEFLYTIGVMLPGTTSIYKRLAYIGLHGYYQSVSGAEAININTKPNGRADISVVKYKENLGEKEEGGGWKALGREKIWHEGAQGREVDLIEGKTPVVFLDDDANDRYPRTVRRAAEAVACDRYNRVYEGASFEQTIVEYNPNVDEERARTDGGEQADAYDLVGQREVSPMKLRENGEFAEDIEVYPESPDGFDGTRLSLSAARELLPEQTDGEKLEDAKQRGILAGMDMDQEPNYWRPYLIATLLVLGILFIIFVLPLIFGDGSGGGVAQRFVGG